MHLLLPTFGFLILGVCTLSPDACCGKLIGRQSRTRQWACYRFHAARALRKRPPYADARALNKLARANRAEPRELLGLPLRGGIDACGAIRMRCADAMPTVAHGAVTSYFWTTRKTRRKETCGSMVGLKPQKINRAALSANVF